MSDPTLDKQIVYAFNQEAPGVTDLIVKICRPPHRPGRFIALTAEEFEALRDSVIALAVPRQPLVVRAREWLRRWRANREFRRRPSPNEHLRGGFSGRKPVPLPEDRQP